MTEQIQKCVTLWFEARAAMDNFDTAKAKRLMGIFEYELNILGQITTEDVHELMAAATAERLAADGKWTVQSYPLHEGGEYEKYDTEREALDYLRECRDYAERGERFEIIQPEGLPAKDEYDPFYEREYLEMDAFDVYESFALDHDWSMKAKI